MPATLPNPTSAPVVKDWRSVRRTYLRGLRKQTRMVILLLALLQALKTGPAEIVYAGRDGYPGPGKDDHGIAYTVGYLISYIYICVFMLFFVPLFSWWLPESAPSDPENPSTMMRVSEYLKKFNMISLPFCAALSGLVYVWYLVEVFVYVDSQVVGSRKLPKNNKKNWMARLLLLCGVAISLTAGYGAFQIWESMDLAHVKTYEYAVMVIPIQINLGIMIGSKMQMKMEKRIAMKEATKETTEEEQALLADEKTASLEV